MKKFLILFSSLIIGMSSFANVPREIDKQLIQLFSTSFPNAQEVTWYELPGSYLVNFVEEGTRAKVIYQKDGAFVRLTRYYSERNLPFYLRLKTNKEYPGKKIFGVTEISTISEKGNLVVEYYIKMEDAKYWITVKSDSEVHFSVVEKYRKI